MRNIPNLYFSETEWEALCDCCGVCCLYKVIDPDTDEIRYTSFVCPFLNPENTRCRSYKNRFGLGVGCTNITPDSMETVWVCLPKHCAYRRIFEGLEIPDWHPLWQDRSAQGMILQTKIRALKLKPKEEIVRPETIKDIMKTVKTPDPTRKLEKQLVRKMLDTDIF